MPPRFLADENFDAKILAGLLRREPSIDFLSAKGADILGLSDPQVLAIAAREIRVLVSHDRETMPAHWRRFIKDSSSAGLLIVDQNLPIREAIEQILTIQAATDQNEWRDQIGFLPF